MSLQSRIQHEGLRQRLMTAEAAAELIPSGANVGMSGFTGAGYPKAVPQALAARIGRLKAQGQGFRIGLWTGASTAPELDGALAQVDAVGLRMPFQSDPVGRARINAGEMEYTDIHLSHVAQHVWFGYYGKLDVAVVEVSGILPDGRLIPSTSVGNNKTWLDQADKIILEVNSRVPAALEGMHDVYYGTALPPHRKPIPLTAPDQRIVLRPQEISNHPELIRRLGIIAMNAMIECDIYGNVNSTHVMGSSIMNGIGGSGDFARNAYLSIFMTPSVAKGGKISCIVPMASHVDNTEHDVQVIVTEQGLADLRGLSPKARAALIIERCAHPDYQPLLRDYVERARRGAPGQHTPHLLGEALSWHQRYLQQGSMQP